MLIYIVTNDRQFPDVKISKDSILNKYDVTVIDIIGSPFFRITKHFIGVIISDTKKRAHGEKVIILKSGLKVPDISYLSEDKNMFILSERTCQMIGESEILNSYDGIKFNHIINVNIYFYKKYILFICEKFL